MPKTAASFERGYPPADDCGRCMYECDVAECSSFIAALLIGAVACVVCVRALALGLGLPGERRRLVVRFSALALTTPFRARDGPATLSGALAGSAREEEGEG